MDGDGSEHDSGLLPNECPSRVHGGVDRISELPNEILFLILSNLPVRKAASTTVLSSRWLHLWKQIPNLKLNLESDRISQLPDHILHVIFSFLMFREAVATGVLSSRWSDLWKHSPYLDFNDNYSELRHGKNFEIVNSVIQLHKALFLKQFRISFPVDRSSKFTVTKWLEFVFSRQVESLELDFSIWNHSDKLVLEESLREMSITCGAPQTLFFCQSLKSLLLKRLKVSGEDVELFLHNCPLLEKLTIRDAHLTSDINVCGATLMLKHLEIFGCTGEKSLTISAPNLSSFWFTDSIGNLVFEYVPKLVEADLRFSSSEFAVQHIALFSQLQILKLTLIRFKELFTDIDMFPHLPSLKKLFVHFSTNTNHSLMPVTALIWTSPRLEEFSLNINNFGDPSASMEDITNVERSPHQHLKVLELQMQSRETDRVVELVTYLSDKCVALREIVIRRWDLNREFQADLEYLKHQLQGKVRGQIQLRFGVLRF